MFENFLPEKYMRYLPVQVYTRNFFKDAKLHSSLRARAILASLKSSLVQVIFKLHSKSYYYLY